MNRFHFGLLHRTESKQQLIPDREFRVCIFTGSQELATDGGHQSDFGYRVTTRIGIVVMLVVEVRVHNRHTIDDVLVHEEIDIDIECRKEQQQTGCYTLTNDMFLSINHIGVQRYEKNRTFANFRGKILKNSIILQEIGQSHRSDLAYASQKLLRLPYWREGHR